MLNYNQLYYFFVTARAGSVTLAARELKISQPSLSSQIKTLESTLGKRLFVRAGRGLKLTAEGQGVFGHCRRIYDAAETLERELAKGQTTGARFHIGVSEEIERPFLVEMVGRVYRGRTSQRERPGKIELTSHPHEELVRLLRARAIDFAVTSEPVFDQEAKVLASSHMPVVLAFNGEGRFKKLAAASASEVRSATREHSLTWALPQRSLRLRKEIDAFFEKGRIYPEIAFESDFMSAVVRAVVEDVGVALVPKPYVRAYARPNQIRWCGPPDGFWGHGIWLVARKGDEHLEQTKAIESAFRASVVSDRTKITER